MRRKGTGLLQDRALVRTKRDELQGNGKATFETVLAAEQLLDRLVEVDAARLHLRTHSVVNSAGHAMLDLMSDQDQEFQVLHSTSWYWAFRMPEAHTQFPIAILSRGRLFDGVVRILIAVVDAFTSIESMHQVRPGDDAGNNEQLCSEGKPRAIESVNGRDHCFPGLDQQFVAAHA